MADYIINKKEATVATPSHAYLEMMEKWELPDVLMEGTEEMREESKRWLPLEPRESPQAYRNRLNRTFLYGVYSRTVKTLAGLPFTRQTIVENIPDELKYLREDCDSTGRSLTNFAHNLLIDEIHYGLTHFLVDMPAFDGTPSLEDQHNFKIRPYFIRISPKNIIGWQTQRVYGVDVLVRLRIKECVIEQDGEWGEKEVDQIRVCYPDRYDIYRENDKKEWYVYQTLPNNLGYIPLVTVYGNRTGYLQGKPALGELAELNLQHYQQMSDLNNIMHVANVPILFGAGFADGEAEGIEIGPNRMITMSDVQGRLSYVEHSGNAISEAMKSIEMLENRMAALGADLVVRKSVDRQTATSRMIDQSETVSLLQMMINNLEAGIAQGIRIAADWLNIEVSDELLVDVGESIDIAQSPNGIDIMLNMLVDQSGMDIEDVQAELKRRGVLTDTFKIGARTAETDSGVISDDNQQIPESTGGMPEVESLNP